LFVGIGRHDATLDAGKYVVTSERNGRITDRRAVEVKPYEMRRLQIELTPTPQFGRRQLIVYSTFGGAVSTAFMLYAFKNTGIATLGSLGGGTAGLVGSYLFLDDDVALGTSNLTITGSLAGGVMGAMTTLLFTGSERVVNPVGGASLVIGAGLGYYIGDRTKVRTGDAALINSSLIWGGVAGAGFAASFGPDRRINAGMVLSGIAMGGIGGAIMTRYFDIGRTHAALIDVGGIVGILGGLAVAGLVYPPEGMGDRFNAEQTEHFANFALGGMAVGLITAGILTRNLDAPKLTTTPSVGTATNADGSKTTTFGLGGSF
jgi:hypothetical protein